jgi:casein kinase 1
MIHNDELVLIDFGLASFYVDAEERHLPPANPKKLHIIGTPRYASFHVHQGEEYSRRDDLISMVYVGLFLIHGPELWEPRRNMNMDSYGEKSDILNPHNQWFNLQKDITNVRTLCSEWIGLGEFAEKVYKLSFLERPSYVEYIEMFAKTI